MAVAGHRRDPLEPAGEVGTIPNRRRATLDCSRGMRSAAEFARK
jgi:hypothetical protein